MRVRKVCELEDREVRQDEIGKGYELTRTRIIPVLDEELRNLPLPLAKAIEIQGFVPWESIDPMERGRWRARRVAGQQAARDPDERLGRFHVPQLHEVLGVGLPVALHEDLVGALDLVEGGAAAIVAGRAKESEHHLDSASWRSGVQNARDGARLPEDCGRLRIEAPSGRLRATAIGRLSSRS
ncbi:Ku protein [Streptomyces herbicida]